MKGYQKQTSRKLIEQGDKKEPINVRGAVYIPTRAFNRYQMWRDYDPTEIDRDFGYAARLSLNAIRTWLSYEYWLENPDAHADRLEHLLETADKYDMQVLLGLFDSVGRAPTLKNLLDEDILTAVQTYSPSGRTMVKKELWERPREFIRWFMQRYRDDDRLLAIELTNEPGWDQRDVDFMREMAKTFTRNRGERPLTVGSTSLENNTEYIDWGIDVLQFHYNFAQTPELYRRVLRQAIHIRSEQDIPIWLSEWQRLRPGKKSVANVSENEAVPNYSSLAPIIHKAGIGNFFWSLMLKPTYTLARRKSGIINGLFHEDGAVWSLDDARAIKAMSGNSSFDGRERQQYPDWMHAIKGTNSSFPGTEYPTKE